MYKRVWIRFWSILSIQAKKSKTLLPSPAGVRKGVAIIIFGVCWTWCLGVAPSKLLSYMGVLVPPFNGVSTCWRFKMFCASCKYKKYWWSYPNAYSEILTIKNTATHQISRLMFSPIQKWYRDLSNFVLISPLDNQIRE